MGQIVWRGGGGGCKKSGSSGVHGENRLTPLVDYFNHSGEVLSNTQIPSVVVDEGGEGAI